MEGGGEGNERLCGDGYHYDYEESVCRDTDECQEEEEEVCGENAVCVNKEPGIWGNFFLLKNQNHCRANFDPLLAPEPCMEIVEILFSRHFW